MSGHGTTSKNRLEARTEVASRGLWPMALPLLALACLCTLAATFAVVAGERDAILGSGTVIAEERPVGHFERVSVGDLGTLIISQGDEEALTVETDDNLMRYVESRVRDGTLILGLSDGAKGWGIKPSNGINYRLSIRHLSGLEVADSGRIQANALTMRQLEILVHDSGNVAVDSLLADALHVYLEDSGDLHLVGRVERQEVVVQDSGLYHAGRLQSRTAVVVVNDSAEAILWATDALDVTVTDSGQLRYYGQPSRVQRLSDDGTLAGLDEP